MLNINEKDNEMLETLVALDPREHNRLRFKKKSDFTFAKSTHICPLMISEVMEAANFSPIVFPSGGKTVVPQMLLSLKANSNPCVGNDGEWIGGYLPLHFRRFPFFLGREKGADIAAVLIEEKAPQFSDKGVLLYNKRGDDFVASPLLKEIKDSLVDMDVRYQKTKVICKLLQNAGVLSDSQIKLMVDGKEQVVKGFSVVNWDKVRKLDDETLANWTRIGLIQLINAHLYSLKKHLDVKKAT